MNSRLLRLIPILLLSAWSAVYAQAPDPVRFAATPEDRHKLRVQDVDLTRQVLEQGGRLVGDYGSFQVLEVNAAGQAALRDQPAVENRDEENRILLNVGAIDPGQSTMQALRQPARAFAGKRLQLVQFDGPIKPEWYQALEKTGVRIVNYIPFNAYLVYGDTKGLAGLTTLASAQSFVRWQGAYLDEDKIQPSARTVDKKGLARAVGTDLFSIQLVEDVDANADTLAQVEDLKLAPVRSVYTNSQMGYVNIVAALPADRLAEVAARPDVVSIHAYFLPHRCDEKQDQIVAGNLNLAGSQPTGPGYLAWLYSKGFTQTQFDASGFVVDIADDGWDAGNAATPLNKEFRKHGDQAQASRMKYSQRATTLAAASSHGADGHGNLNISIVGGYNELTGSPFEDGSGFNFGLGVCPFANLGNTKVFADGGAFEPDGGQENAFISANYGQGVRISSDSWGSTGDGSYDSSAQAYDAYTRDAQGGQPLNQQMLFVFAAGNDGSGASTIGPPGSAKNVISVGAAENYNQFGTDGCGVPNSGADNANDIIDFSSRGPCLDGRKKPDIVAPGTHIQGAASFYSNYNGSSVCDQYQPAGQTNYASSSGTSHSTPAVAGGAALVYQYFINQGWSNSPSPAMVKAYLMNSARYMTGVSANDTLPSNNQGMGGMNLGLAFDGVARVRRDQATNEVFTASGQTRVYTGVISDNTKPFRVTLGWSDAYGATSGNAFNNNLDLTVIVGGNTYKGNVFSGADSIPGGSADPRNNVESVFLPAGVSGTFAVIVTATSINSDGVPHFGGALDQDFALVVYNGLEADEAVVLSAGSQLIAENCGSGNGVIDPREAVSVRLGLGNIGTVNTTNLVATLLATNGVTLPSSAQSYGALVAGGASVSNTFTFTSTGTCGGTVSATLQLQDGAADLGTVQFDFTMGLSIVSTVTNAKPGVVTIPDSGTATPYPSTNLVAGLPGSVAKVTVSLLGFTHTFPADLDVLLVGPSGENCLILSGVGTNIVNNVNLTFDDDAAGAIPANGSIVSGTYRPSDGGVGANLTAPAPSPPYGSALSVFDGTNPNGAWKLFILDAEAGDSGSLATGWRLDLTVSDPVCCATNVPPVLAPIGAKSVIVSNLLQFAVSGSDLGDLGAGVVTLSASNLPGWATFATTSNFGAVTNLFSGTPDTTGVFTVTFYAADNDGSDAEIVPITVTPPPAPTTNIAGWSLIQSNASLTYTFPPGTVIRGGSYLILSRDSTKAEFEAFYGVTLDSDVEFLTSTGTVPQINGAETYTLKNNLGVLRDGTTPPSLNPLNNSIQRRSANSNATLAASWKVVASTAATPGSGGSGNGSGGVVINEYSDAVGTGNFIYEFVELYYDQTGGGGGAETPPVLSPIGDKSIVVSNTLEFAVTATPTEGDQVTLSNTNLPPGSSFSSVNQNGFFAWTNASPTGVYVTTFFAADNDGTNSEQITITVSAAPVVGPTPNVWINEIHFDNTGGDVGEGAEVAGPAGTDLSSFKLLAVNGANGVVYNTNALSGTIADQGCGYGAIWFGMIGLQNGSPDGLALVYNNSNVIQFLSYIGGIFNGGQAPLIGLTAASLGVSENSSTPVGYSLQLAGTGTNAVQFAWRAPTNSSHDALNVGQLISDCGGLPGVVITTLNQTVANVITSFVIGGTANTNTSGHLQWTNNLTSLSGIIPAVTNWLVDSVGLAVGVNGITVKGSNSAGLTASGSVNITRQAPSGGGATNLILFQGFESGDNWTITNGSAFVFTDGGVNDTPANQRIRTGTHSWQVRNTNITLDLIQASIIGYTSRQASVRLSSVSGNNGNGADTSDFVRVFVALDGAAFSPTADVSVAGFTNATWGYWATNILITTAGTPVSGHSTNRTTATVTSNDIASVFVLLPDSATSIALRVSAINSVNATSEIWNVDDIAVTGLQIPVPNNDVDGDDLPDDWEMANFGNLTSATNTPESDFDLDGFSDLFEYLAGTGPADGDSYLKATVIENLPAGELVIQWASESNKLYILTRTTNLLSDFIGVASNLAATPPLNTYTDAVATNSMNFYRVNLQ